ncbi:MAG: hypothetical protein H0V21_02435 [Rubrobacter sp.]|nr:hypothetical protein [Rubrobacter sp.]
MDKILAIEQNNLEFLMALGRAAGAEERDDGLVRWAIGGSPIYLCGYDAHMARTTAHLGRIG